MQFVTASETAVLTSLISERVGFNGNINDATLFLANASFSDSDKNVIVVEDVLDTGHTLKNLVNYLERKNPKCIKIATFVDKPARRKENIKADYCGVVMEDDLFIVGYGLDYAQKYRNLPFIAALKESIYTHNS